MAAGREHFSSRLGFVLAATGAAVGLGNIWGFPTQAASNGGGAFLIVYLLMILIVAYPMLLVEMAIGRHGQANPIDSMRKLGRSPLSKMLGGGVGLIGLLVPCLVLAFYSIVGGWLISYLLAAGAELMGLHDTAIWLKGFSVERNLLGAGLFYLLTILIVQAGVKEGIEKWSTRLMPALFILFAVLFIYVMTLPGATDGLAHYLIPDFSKVMDGDLILAAMGQGFFSLTIGGCSMLIYGSYLSRKENLPQMALNVTLVDTAVAVIAGLVILPAMFAAMHQGVEIYDTNGALLSSSTLVFDVLPMLFEGLGVVGTFVALVFFLLMTIAALTSSISMLECPVALMSERLGTKRSVASWLLGGVIAAFSLVIVFNFGELFGLVATIATQYFQPIAALLFCLYGGWVWKRTQKLKELRQGYDDIEQSFFWKVWPLYVKFVCPVLVIAVIWMSLV
ncbi:sodium-dependent transporter [Grimontia marina]|uniref:Sodium:neurotransmitter symporter family protein n=1 Tax=Grimontia marina TaxID=646534 RepID=A0A128ETQ4_9GAMM|nr:sodium-dependent transporter [Grimontia marina]CZF77967.1 Sodium:neurotransmitter symporter family protein [Grimontia marina]